MRSVFWAFLLAHFVGTFTWRQKAVSCVVKVGMNSSSLSSGSEFGHISVYNNMTHKGRLI